MKADYGNISNSVSIVAEPWLDSAYYGIAEKYTADFWNVGSPFRRLFDHLEMDVVIDLACGYGRHAEVVAPKCSKLILIDVIERNLKVSKVRLNRFSNITYICNNGFDYEPVRENQISSVYCYDAMVHFSYDIVRSYILDTFRILKPGGRAFFHHSNYDASDDRHYGQNPHARNKMTQKMFKSFARAAGLRIVESTLIDWGGSPNLDCLTLLEKPRE